MRLIFILSSIFVISIILLMSYFHPQYIWLFLLFGPLILMGVYDLFQDKHSIRKNFPLIGRLRYFFESISPEIQQYFIERNTDGKPFSRNERSLVYRRSKNISATHPFGTQQNINHEKYEYLPHSIFPKEIKNHNPKVVIGSSQCTKPYNASILNISAMSFGSLSKNAVMALNQGTKKGGFYHNTGEGGVSPYHLQGGDLVWQIGTGYFGCRDNEGNFDEKLFSETALLPEVRMIEIKLSQGAKPGHGGVLPGKKVTEEIAKIRKIEAHKTVLSPPYHKAFNSAEGLIHFVQELRELSHGKPIGFKLCIGKKDEFKEICEAIRDLEIYPDFITIDGAEGGTGAAPLEFSDSVGLPLDKGLVYADKLLKEFGLRNQIKIIASGKILSGFSIIKHLALGADLCNSARAFMFSVGCIQALKCNNNECPTGVATQKASLVKGLDIEDKADRVYHFHKNTVHATMELLGAAGLDDITKLSAEHILKNKSNNQIETLETWLQPTFS